MSTVTRLAEMVEPLEKGFTERFPDGFVSVRHTTNLKDCVTVRVAREPRTAWANGIYENASYATLMVTEASRSPREGTSGRYEVTHLSGTGLGRMRKRTGTAQQVVDHVLKFFAQAATAA